MSCVTIFSFFFYHLFSLGQTNEASRWRVCYQQGLPHLVYMIIPFKKKTKKIIIIHEVRKKLGPTNLHDK